MKFLNIPIMLLIPLLFVSPILLAADKAPASEPQKSGEAEYPQVQVVEPYIELHTGPGRGYPVFHVVAGGDEIRIIKRRTSWFLVESTDRRAVRGWAKHDTMAKTATSVDPDNGIRYARFPGFEKHSTARFRWSVAGGEFSGAASIATSLAYRLTPNIHLQLEGTQILGDFSDGKMLNAAVQHYPFPNWRASPYFQLGAGILQTEPSATLVQAEDRTDNTLMVGGGMNVYLGRRFNLFLDYRRYTLLTSRDDNEEIDEWKIGFNVSF